MMSAASSGCFTFAYPSTQQQMLVWKARPQWCGYAPSLCSSGSGSIVICTVMCCLHVVYSQMSVVARAETQEQGHSTLPSCCAAA